MLKSNPLHQKKFDKLKEIAEKEGIVSNDNAVIEQKLGPTEDSVGMRRNPMFEEVWRLLRGNKAYIKPTDQISTKSAEKIVKEWNKVAPEADSVSKMEKYQDETSLELTKDFEARFPIIVQFSKSVALALTATCAPINTLYPPVVRAPPAESPTRAFPVPVVIASPA